MRHCAPLSAQFEHTIGVTQTGHEILTLSPKGLDEPPYWRANFPASNSLRDKSL